MRKSYKKQIILTFIGLIAFCILVMVIVSNLSNNKDTGVIKNSLTDENDTLYLTGKLPVSDYVVKNKDVLTFDESVVDYVNFNVYSEGYNGNFSVLVESCNDPENEKVLEDQYIKIIVTDGENKLLSTTDKGKVKSFNELKVLDDDFSKKIVYTDSISSGNKKEYILKIWVSDSYLADAEKSYCMKVSVK